MSFLCSPGPFIITGVCLLSLGTNLHLHVLCQLQFDWKAWRRGCVIANFVFSRQHCERLHYVSSLSPIFKTLKTRVFSLCFQYHNTDDLALSIIFHLLEKSYFWSNSLISKKVSSYEEREDITQLHCPFVDSVSTACMVSYWFNTSWSRLQAKKALIGKTHLKSISWQEGMSDDMALNEKWICCWTSFGKFKMCFLSILCEIDDQLLFQRWCNRDEFQPSGGPCGSPYFKGKPRIFAVSLFALSLLGANWIGFK